MREKLRWIFLVISVVILCKLVSDHCFQLMMIQGNSMSPTYRPYRIVLLDKRTRDYQLGDVVAFHSEGLSAVLVKRIAAKPGDTAVIEHRTLLVNGEISPFYDEGVFEFSGLLENEISLSAGEYVVIGDNVDESKDSRYQEVGIVKAKWIIGRVLTF